MRNARFVQTTVQVPLGVRLCPLDRWPVSILVPEGRAMAGHGGRGTVGSPWKQRRRNERGRGVYEQGLLGLVGLAGQCTGWGCREPGICSPSPMHWLIIPQPKPRACWSLALGVCLNFSFILFYSPKKY